jgi:hypothetical protein
MLRSKSKKFCDACPRKLSQPPDTPCPMALESIYLLQTSPKTVNEDNLPCPWYINSAEDGYCFFNYVKKIDQDPISDKDICRLLLIDQQTLEKTFQSAIQKLKNLKDSTEITELIDSVREKLSTMELDNTIYLPDRYIEPKETEEEGDQDKQLEEELDKKLKFGLGMPVHRSKKRTDLYGLYSKKKLEELKKAKKDEKKKKDSN